MNRIGLALCCVLFAVFVHADNLVPVGTAGSRISQLLTFSGEAHNDGYTGDLLINISNLSNSAVCAGVWIQDEDPQFPELMQLLLAAKVTGSSFQMYANPENLWPYSSGKYCYLSVLYLL